ncbi:MAG: radical SAM protein [Candidatus Methanomethyliaceae archaeon]|nr:radical SAM protein [Candidatus Methanomethyliaceae archaeon]
MLKRSDFAPQIIPEPILHALVPTKKSVVHGWYFPYKSGRRECSSERILVNPYNGCTINCPMCYARAYKGHFEEWNRTGIVTVFKDIDKKLNEELRRLYYASCGYFSPVTDPFQSPLEEIYHLSELCMEAFLKLDLPVEFVTKNGSKVPDRLLKRMSEQPFNHCFCQYTLLSLNEEIRKTFSPGGSTVEEQLKAVQKSKDRGLYVAVRIDPILPGINDSLRDLSDLLDTVKERGADHIIASVCDVNPSYMDRLLTVVRSFGDEIIKLWRSLYTERIGLSYQASEAYRSRIFRILRDLSTKKGLTFALCMEFRRVGRGYMGMNSEFMTSKVCEGKIVPVYFRSNLKENFRPISGCDGDCLSCAKGVQEPVCNKRFLMEADAMTLSKYLRLKPDVPLFNMIKKKK